MTLLYVYDTHPLPHLLYHAHASSRTVISGKPGLSGSPVLSLSIILFNTISPCPSQTEEETAVKEDEWR